jgi:hypothetical protein
MNKLKYALMSSLLVAGIAQAGTPCNNFEIKVKNNLSDGLVARSISLQGADIKPKAVHQLNTNAEETFTISNAINPTLQGELIFNTISLPTKEVKIRFDLSNTGAICEHSDHSQSNDLNLSKTRLPGKVTYTIGY